MRICRKNSSEKCQGLLSDLKFEESMISIKAKDVKPFWTNPPNRRELKVLLSPEEHGTSPYLGMGIVSIPPGESGNKHVHMDTQETWFILSGFGKLAVGDEEINLEPEMVVVAPQGIAHKIINDGKEDLRALFIFSPAGPELDFVIK